MARKRDARDRQAAATPAIAALVAAGAWHVVHPYEHDPTSTSYGEEAAAALGLSPDRVLKTLVLDVDGELCVGVVPVAGMLDLKAAAAALGGRRARMADVAAAQRATGYVVGGISPLGQRRALRTVVDASALTHETVYCSAGRRGVDVELRPADLVALAGAVVAPVSRPS
ncbi:Cys-tRNA(Pro) deacylase [Nocardioides sp. CPCC 205120]|uniref:Cys-tRNA(Pro) deacylase n=1 Tax=Nocardioides sp. CPCC 205120 TaxID=3406462 RepID=UPI003B503805